MALTATLYRVEVELSDVGRGVYETLELRVARHPSESARYMVARILAYCLRYEEGIDFGRGVSSADEPAVWIKNLRGEVTAWIDVGQPTPERLHRASKTGARVYVYAHKDPAPLLRELDKSPIHRQDELEVWELPASVLDALEASIGRQERWALTVSDGEIYLTRGTETLSGAPVRHALGG